MATAHLFPEVGSWVLGAVGARCSLVYSKHYLPQFQGSVQLSLVKNPRWDRRGQEIILTLGFRE